MPDKTLTGIDELYGTGAAISALARLDSAIRPHIEAWIKRELGDGTAGADIHEALSLGVWLARDEAESLDLVALAKEAA